MLSSRPRCPRVTPNGSMFPIVEVIVEISMPSCCVEVRRRVRLFTTNVAALVHDLQAKISSEISCLDVVADCSANAHRTYMDKGRLQRCLRLSGMHYVNNLQGLGRSEGGGEDGGSAALFRLMMAEVYMAMAPKIHRAWLVEVEELNLGAPKARST